eukprot:scaffold139373_cov28-Tisochrysis_lutea.AAC.2
MAAFRRPRGMCGRGLRTATLCMLSRAVHFFSLARTWRTSRLVDPPAAAEYAIVQSSVLTCISDYPSLWIACVF